MHYFISKKISPGKVLKSTHVHRVIAYRAQIDSRDPSYRTDHMYANAGRGLKGRNHLHTLYRTAGNLS